MYLHNLNPETRSYIIVLIIPNALCWWTTDAVTSIRAANSWTCKELKKCISTKSTCQIWIKPGMVPIAYLQVCSSSQQISPRQWKQWADTRKTRGRFIQLINSIFGAGISFHILFTGRLLVGRPCWCLRDIGHFSFTLTTCWSEYLQTKSKFLE